MIFPSGVRQISVPWYQIVTVSFFDVPILKYWSFRSSVVEDCSDMHVLDLVVVLVASCSNFDSSNENVFEFSSFPLSFDGSKQSSKVLFLLHIESCVPLSVFMMIWYRSNTCAAHGEFQNDLISTRAVGQWLYNFMFFAYIIFSNSTFYCLRWLFFGAQMETLFPFTLWDPFRTHGTWMGLRQISLNSKVSLHQPTGI